MLVLILRQKINISVLYILKKPKTMWNVAVAVRTGAKYLLSCVQTCCSRGGYVRDIRVVVEVRRVIIDVSHRHGHGGGAGQALRLPSICCHNQQLVIGPLLSIQQGAGDDLSCSRVDRELAVSSTQAVAVGKTNKDCFSESFVFGIFTASTYIYMIFMLLMRY